LRARELEGVLQQIDDNRRQNLAIGVNDCSGFAGLHDEPEVMRCCFHRRCRRQIRNECCHSDKDPILNPLPQSDLSERTIDEVAQPRQAGFEHGSRTAADSDVAALQDVERSARRVEKIPDLMREESDSFVLAGRFGLQHRLIALSAELCDGARDRIVKAPIQRPEIVDLYRDRPLQGQVGD
jgi:hypothetical protein